MIDRDIEAVRRLLLTGDEGSPAGHAAAWFRFRRQLRPRRRRGWRARGAVALAIAVAALVFPALLTTERGPGGLPTGSPPSANAALVLRRAADQLRDDRPLGPGEVRVIRVDARQLVTEKDAHGRIHRYVLPRAWETRSGADGSWALIEHPSGRPEFGSRAAADRYEQAFGAYVDKPKPPITRPSDPSTPNPDWLGLSANDVLRLPTDVDRLVRLLAKRTGREGDGPQDVADAALRLLTFCPTPPRVRAALAELLAQVPGTRVIGEEEVGGRPGVTLRLPRRPVEQFIQELVIDEQRGELLADRSLNLRGDVQSVLMYRSTIAESLSEDVKFGPAPTLSGRQPVPPER